MDSFATVTQLEASWRALSGDEIPIAENKLGRATRIIRALKPDVDAQVDAGKLSYLTLADVVCEMVRRSMVAPAAGEGVSTGQFTAGPFSQSQTFTNPDSALYLSKLEKKMLGIGRATAFTVDMTPVASPYYGGAV